MVYRYFINMEKGTRGEHLSLRDDSFSGSIGAERSSRLLKVFAREAETLPALAALLYAGYHPLSLSLPLPSSPGAATWTFGMQFFRNWFRGFRGIASISDELLGPARKATAARATSAVKSRFRIPRTLVSPSLSQAGLTDSLVLESRASLLLSLSRLFSFSPLCP